MSCQLRVVSEVEADDFGNGVVSFDHFLMIRFNLSEISGFDQLAHFLVYTPELFVSFSFHFIDVLLDEVDISGNLNYCPISIFHIALEVAGSFAREQEGSIYLLRSRKEVFVDCGKHDRLE